MANNDPGETGDEVEPVDTEETEEKTPTGTSDFIRSYNERLSNYEPKRFGSVKIEPELPVWEIRLYIFYLIAILLYTSYEIFKFSTELIEDNLDEYWEQPGVRWKIFRRPQDSVDGEWAAVGYLCPDLFTVAAVHVISSLVVAYFAYQYRRHVWLTVGVCGILYILGWKALLFLLAVMGSLYLASLSASVIVTWCVLMFWVLGTNATYIPGMQEAMGGLVINENVDESEWHGFVKRFHIMYMSYAFMLLRVASFAIEKAKRLNGTSNLGPEVTFSFFDALVYTFYVPNFFTGPCFIYKYFQAEITKPRAVWSRDEIFHIAHRTVRSVIVMFFLDIMLCFLYFHTIGNSTNLIGESSVSVVGGLVLLFPSFYQSKYIVTYGLAACVMMADRIVPPSLPRCIFRVAYFSDYWRYFDPGLHGFFRNYVYIELGGSRYGRIRQIVATFCTFAFVGLWHGARKNMIVYCMVNCAAIFVELFSSKFVQRPAVAEFEAKYLGPKMTRRIHTALNVPSFVFSTYAIMNFYTNYENATAILFRLVINGTLLSRAGTFMVLYSITMLSQEMERWTHISRGKDKSQ